MQATEPISAPSLMRPTQLPNGGGSTTSSPVGRKVKALEDISMNANTTTSISKPTQDLTSMSSSPSAAPPAALQRFLGHHARGGDVSPTLVVRPLSSVATPESSAVPKRLSSTGKSTCISPSVKQKARTPSSPRLYESSPSAIATFPPLPQQQIIEEKLPITPSDEITPTETFPSLEQRKTLMDMTINKLKQDIDIVKKEGLRCELLQVYAEKLVTERQRALRDAVRHRDHMIEVSEEVRKHDVEEAEVSFRSNLEQLRESMLEERISELQRYDEILAAANQDVPVRTMTTRNTRSKNVKIVDSLFETGGTAAGGGEKGQQRTDLSNGNPKRRKGQHPANVFLSKSLEDGQVERDISQITRDAQFAIEDPDEEDESQTQIEVKVHKHYVQYGDVQLQKGDSLLVTLAHSEDHFFAVLQSFNNNEVLLKLTGEAARAAMASSRKRIGLQDLEHGKVFLDLHSHPSGSGYVEE